MTDSRAGRLAYYGLPMLFCVAVHWIAIKTWFRADDFAWLGLRFEIHSPHDFLNVLFEPRAQGTVRTLSERVYFLLFSSVFGMNALPMRLWEFLTQFANIALLMAITRRITGSKLAAFIAPILWCACAPSAIPLNWSAAYNEICFGFFLLLAFYLLLRYAETGDSRFWIAQWVVFLLGFGVLELNVMYPAVAAAYALLCERKLFRRTLYLFVPSILFTFLHFRYVPPASGPDYAMHFNAQIGRLLWGYWCFALGAGRPERVDWRPVWLGVAVTLAVTAALLAFIVSRIRRNDWRGFFLLAWFFLVIAPVLPLTQHFTEYYPLLPSIGIAMLAGWALAAATARWWYALALVFLAVSISEVHSSDHYFYGHARVMKHLIKMLEANRAADAAKKIFLNGVDSEIFWSGFLDDPFRLIGIPAIYLTPGSEEHIDPHPELGGISRFIVSRDFIMQALNAHQGVVYSVTDDGIKNVTQSYQAIASAEQLAAHRETIDVGNPIYKDRLGPGWYNIENSTRWMGHSASVQLSVPRNPGQNLIVSGFCPAAAVGKGPVSLTIYAEGRQLGKASLKKPDESFTFTFSVPPDLAGKDSIKVTAEVNRTFTLPSDPRTLGLVFGTFRIK